MAPGDTGRLAGLDPEFMRHFEAFRAAALGRHSIRVQVVSGFRTRAEQETLYALYRAGRGNVAAPPGTSRHESGRAIDMDPDVDEAPALRPLLDEFGLCLPVRSPQWEPWHVEPCWTQPRTSPLYRPQPVLDAGPLPTPLREVDPMADFIARFTDGTLYRVCGGRRRPVPAAPNADVPGELVKQAGFKQVNLTAAERGQFEAMFPDELEG